MFYVVSRPLVLRYKMVEGNEWTKTEAETEANGYRCMRTNTPDELKM